MINKYINFDESGLAFEDGVIRVYNYHVGTKEYIGFSDETVLQGVGIAANACIDAPGLFREGHAICRASNFHHWEYIPDHRGETVYSCKTGEPLQITQPGDYPEHFTVLKPSSSYDIWNGTTWVTDNVAMKNQQIVKAEKTKSELLSNAKSIISEWQSELQLGVIDEKDRASLTSWLAYIKEVKSVDTSAAPEIVWPMLPVNQAS